jgi:hypothetical protein
MTSRRVFGSGLTAIVVSAFSIVTGVGCGGGGAASGTGGAGGSGNAGGTTGGTGVVYKACTAETVVGNFGVTLDEGMGTPYATFAGRVRDGVYPLTYWKTDSTVGKCKMVVRPTCTPTCATGTSCGVGSQCIAEPTSHSVGAVDVAGLSVAIAGLAPAGNQYNKDLSAGAYPPAAAGTLVTLHAAGGDYATFTLAAREVEPLEFAGTGITVNRNQALPFTWTAPASGAHGKILAVLNIAYHGGGKNRIECEVDDTGAAEIPAELINKLLDAGTAGFPTLALTRRSVDSTTLAPPGCIEFEVSAYRERQVTVCPQPGMCIISCGQEAPCPTGMACGNDKKCS